MWEKLESGRTNELAITPALPDEHPAPGSSRSTKRTDIINARVGVNADRWSLELFAENLGNSRGLTNRNFYPFSLTAMTQMEVVTPRTIGVDLSVKF